MILSSATLSRPGTGRWGPTDLDDPALVTQHDLLMSPQVWDLAHVPARSRVIGWPTRCPPA
jgi:hypothetical protein